MSTKSRKNARLRRRNAVMFEAVYSACLRASVPALRHGALESERRPGLVTPDASTNRSPGSEEPGGCSQECA